jgi:WD40 repeat protein
VMGRLQTYDVDTGAPAAAVFVRPDAPFVRPGSVTPRDTRSVLLLDDRAGVLLPLAPEDDTTAGIVLGHIAEHHGSAALAEAESQVTAVGSGPGSPYAVVGDRSGTLHVWSLSDYQDTPRSCRVHELPVTAATCLHVAAHGMTLTFSAAMDGSVRLWETSAEPMPVPIQQRGYQVTALAAADTPVGPVLAVAWGDGELHLWHVFSGSVRTLPLLHACGALALTPDGLLVIGDPEGLYAVRLRLDGLWKL